MEHPHSHKAKSPHWGQAFEVVPSDAVVIEDSVASTTQNEILALPLREEVVVPMSLEERNAMLLALAAEGRALVKLAPKGFAHFVRTLFMKRPLFNETGIVHTKAGRELILVEDQKGKKFVRYDLYRATRGVSKSGKVTSLHLPYEMVLPFLQ